MAVKSSQTEEKIGPYANIDLRLTSSTDFCCLQHVRVINRQIWCNFLQPCQILGITHNKQFENGQKRENWFVHHKTTYSRYIFKVQQQRFWQALMQYILSYVRTKFDPCSRIATYIYFAMWCKQPDWRHVQWRLRIFIAAHQLPRVGLFCGKWKRVYTMD